MVKEREEERQGCVGCAAIYALYATCVPIWSSLCPERESVWQAGVRVEASL